MKMIVSTSAPYSSIDDEWHTEVLAASILNLRAPDGTPDMVAISVFCRDISHFISTGGDINGIYAKWLQTLPRTVEQFNIMFEQSDDDASCTPGILDCNNPHPWMNFMV